MQSGDRLECRMMALHHYGQKWTASEDAMLGRLHDEEVARRLGRTMLAVRTRRLRKGRSLRNPKRRPWTSQEEKLLGTSTDREVARLLARHHTTVGERRRELGIPPAPSAKQRDWTLAELRLLGTAPDREIA